MDLPEAVVNVLLDLAAGRKSEASGDSALFRTLTKAEQTNGNHPDLTMVRDYFLRELPKFTPRPGASWHGFSVVRLTQSLPGLRAACESRDETHALSSHCRTRIFHLQTGAVTNEWASKSIGHAILLRTSEPRNERDQGNPNLSMAETQGWDCSPETFPDLKTGGKRNRGVAEA